MPAYHLYRLDPDTGHISSAEDIEAADDAAAADQVQHRGYTVPVELWDGGRKVARIDSTPEAAAYRPAIITDGALMRGSNACLNRSWELLRQTTPDHR